MKTKTKSTDIQMKTKDDNSRFRTKRGHLTRLAFACGRIESYKTFEISLEGGLVGSSGNVNYWNVRGGRESVGRFVWRIFPTLTQARRYARDLYNKSLAK